VKRLRVLVPHLHPNSLFGRLVLMWVLVLWVAHLVNFAIGYYSDFREELVGVQYHLVKDVATAVDVLERTPPDERRALLEKLQRRQYTYLLEATEGGRPVQAARTKGSITGLEHELGPAYHLSASEQPDGDMRIHLALHDGTPLTVQIAEASMPLSYWPALILMVQLLAAVLVTWIAIRHATRPLTRLAQAAESVGSSLRFEPIPETGPTEVAAAATAFNGMQRRIAEHIEERTRILAAISHDLQTPITRMRLRTDLADIPDLRDKFHADLDAMQVLVEEGIAYARAQSHAEPPCRIDLDAFLDSIAGDYIDTARPVARSGRLGQPLTTRPNALKRIVINLLDNACKFGSDVELAVERNDAEEIIVTVCDRGPGIPESELEAVLQPFYRLESSRNRDTGGTGLGLAIAQQLSLVLGGTLSLANRPGGGLEARLILPRVQPK
jgi:signal transduction histidine kinase